MSDDMKKYAKMFLRSLPETARRTLESAKGTALYNKIMQSEIMTELDDMLEAYIDRDPAARSKLEILLLYPGVHALILHRLAHRLYKKKKFFLARAVSQFSRSLTGIEIHPGAKIGKRFVIDHGLGVVIGETTVIGDDVLIYQGVTLGGSGKDTVKRHPTIGNNVMVGCGAKVLGSFKVGDGARIASNAVVLKEIPENATAVGMPARVVRIAGEKVDDLDHTHIPDLVSAELEKLSVRIRSLEEKEEKRKSPRAKQQNTAE